MFSTASEFQYRYPLQPWLVCCSAACFFFFGFMQINIFNTLNPYLIQDFHLSSMELGHLSAGYFYAVVFFLLPAGTILDRFSTRLVILIAMGLMVVAALLFSVAQVFWQAELCRLITGMSGAFAFLSGIRLASRWFPAQRLALVVGLMVTFAMMGGFVAQAPFALLMHCMGWRISMIVDGLMGVVMLLAVFVWVRDFPSGTKSADQPHADALQWVGLWAALKKVIHNPQNWLSGLYISLMNLLVFLLGALWGISYLVQIRGLETAEASLVTSMIFVGMILGSPAVGWFSDGMGSRKFPMILGAVLSLVLILLLMYVPHWSFIELLLMFLALGFVTSAQVIGYPLIAESNSLTLVGTAQGLGATLIMAGGFTQPLFASLLNWHWDHHVVNQVPVYSAQNYLTGLWLMPVAFGLALLMALLVKETHCQHTIND